MKIEHKKAKSMEEDLDSPGYKERLDMCWGDNGRGSDLVGRYGPLSNEQRPFKNEIYDEEQRPVKYRLYKSVIRADKEGTPKYYYEEVNKP